MYNSQLPNPLDVLTTSRIERIKPALRALEESTLEGYVAEVYSAVNGVLNIDGKMQPLRPVPAEAPATVGDITLPLLSLSQDAADILSVITSAETTAAQLYNLAAGAQNEICQKLRESFYASSASQYLEPFLNDRGLGNYTATLDYSAGQATLSETSTAAVTAAAVVAGPGSTAGGVLTVTPSTASDGSALLGVNFTGPTLELVISFAAPTILNRLKIELASYDGLELSTLTSSPDGTVFQDVLADLGVSNQVLNGLSGKLSGSVLLDFPPRWVSQMRIVFNDRVGAGAIQLDSISFWARQFAASAALTTQLITAPQGNLLFTADASTWGSFTTLLHQISTNGVHFTAVEPGAVITADAPFYYRAQLQRVSAAFSSGAAAVSQDPALSPNFVLSSSSTVNLGSNVLQRKLSFGSVSGPVTIQDSPLPGTFQVLQGSVPLLAPGYTYERGVLSFPAEVFNVTVSYQTSSVGATAIAALENFYTPILREVRFESA